MDNIFISTTFGPDKSKLSEILPLCAQNNFTNLELGSNHCYEDNFHTIIKKFNFNYLVHNYFPIPKDLFVVNIASLNDEIYVRSLRHIFTAIDFTQQIGGKLYTFHPGFLTDVKESANKSNYDFVFSSENLDQNTYGLAFQRMLIAIRQIVEYAKIKQVKVAIETEGSISKKDYLLMQRPEEYKLFFQHFSPSEMGINLNLGHLILASKAFNFEKHDFVDLIADYVVAMELSHNEGVNDDHLPLKAEGWYWKFIRDPRFSHCYKIIETRNSGIGQLKECISYF
ncbi:MAG TPA: TIM barrel protein [Candidatus Nanoarchaeia archaeon]|nr:TIM barrel protein [Candidatus Nanoarchaeia archaeon]